MASVVDIWNRSLQELGATRVTALTDTTSSARECNQCYDIQRHLLLSEFDWNCARKRGQLAADATAPVFGKSFKYPLPSDFLRLAIQDDSKRITNTDWQIESGDIHTNDVAPLNIVYIFDLTDPNVMDVFFREALALKMALAMCEAITQSNSKQGIISAKYGESIKSARRSNAFMNKPRPLLDGSFITSRN